MITMSSLYLTANVLQKQARLHRSVEWSMCDPKSQPTWSFFINFKQPFCRDLSQLLLRFHDGSDHDPTEHRRILTCESRQVSAAGWPPRAFQRDSFNLCKWEKVVEAVFIAGQID
jgi:hypothetical protein